jgi:CDP-2,3-bis-(O-geranylgeranyl)-sn-glycerol synthase
MWMLILQSLYFFLPAYIANMMPALLIKVPYLNKPIWEKKLGKNKTWKGLVAGMIFGGLVFLLQKIAYGQGFTSLAMIDYSDYPILLGALMGLGALVGDSVKSYYKRKEGIPPGKSWIPFDQLDFVFGGIIFSFLVYVPKAEVVLILIIASPILHIATNTIGYLLKIRDDWK